MAVNIDRSVPKTRILFLAEAMTLCHVVRPLVLAQSLSNEEYEVHFASSSAYRHLFQGLSSATLHSIRSVPSKETVDRMAHGRPNFSTDTLRRYVKDDLRLIDETSPDLIVGDMRLSLAVSARLSQLPYLAITNAHWSPFSKASFEVPELPINRLVGSRIANHVFKMVKPLAFARHCAPLNRVRREYGLPSLGSDLQRSYTSADHVLYADVPELVPTFSLPSNHHYLGPILWSYPAPLPAWWDRLPVDRPVVYVSLGSSGNAKLLRVALEALCELSVTAIGGTSGRVDPKLRAKNVFIAEHLPAREIAARASLVICHGGSAPAYVALATGTPVLAVPSNMDNHQTAQYVEKAGAGMRLRAEQATAKRIRRAVTEMLSNPAYTDAARGLADICSRYDTTARFRRLLSNIVQRGLRPGQACANRVSL